MSGKFQLKGGISEPSSDIPKLAEIYEGGSHANRS